MTRQSMCTPAFLAAAVLAFHGVRGDTSECRNSMAEEEVEMQEDAELQVMRQELLQTGVRSIKAGESYHAGARVEVTEESDAEMLIARGLHSDEQAVQHVVSRVLQLQQPPTWEGEG
ncbi:unnamed protein product, partial [Symbiodinium necroappetens]